MSRYRIPLLAACSSLLWLAACTPSSAIVGEDDGVINDGSNPGTTGGSTVTTGPDSPTDTDPEPEPDPNDVDDDGDGFTENEGDCDDSDDDANPDGDEGNSADGADNDCNGTADDRSVCPGEVGTDYETIQEGIDDAPSDFVLLICEGMYAENLTIDDQITLRSVDGPEVTIVAGDGTAPTIRINGVRNSGAGVDGLTVTAGYTEGSGGGISVTNSEVQLLNNIITNNHALTYGGGVMLSSSTGLVQGNTISSNSAEHGGGLVVWEGDVEIDSNLFEYNEATIVEVEDQETWGSGGGGGGALIYGNSPVNNNTFNENVTQYNGGGLYILYSGGDILGNTFTSNISHEDGAGVYTNQSRNEFSGNTVAYNEAYDDAGGLRVYVGTMTITDNTFIGNVAGDDAGGLKLSHSQNTIERNHFEDNQAGDAGGGLELDNDTSDVIDSTFIGNVATRGAGLHSWRNEGPINLERLEFDGNVAWDCGGGMQMDNNPYLVRLIDIVSRNNEAVDGAALCIDFHWLDDEMTVSDESNIALYNGLLVDNVSSDDGGALYVKHGHLLVSNSTLVDNWAPTGSAIAVKEATAEITNSILAHNDDGAGIWVEKGASVEVSYSNVHDNDGGEYEGMADQTGTAGNIDEDPLFVDRTTDDYSLTGASPCVDAGNPSIQDTDGSRSDMGVTGGPFAP